MPRDRRSPCPIAYSLDLFGDRWSLLILRDMVFGKRRYYRDFIVSPEGIATNVLADRLNRLEAAGLIDKRRDPDNRKRNVYTLTQKGRDTIPILLDLIVWGGMYDEETPVTPQFLERVKRDRDTVIAELEAKVPRYE